MITIANNSGREQERLTLGLMESGDTFMFNDSVWMRTDALAENNMVQCVELNTGILSNLEADLDFPMVTIKAELETRYK